MKIKNRDVLALSQVMYIMQDVCKTEKRRAWLRERMFSLSQHMSGMPGAKGGIPQGFDATLAAIDDADDQYLENLKQYFREMEEAEKILNAIEDRKMRTFVFMMYVDNLPGSTVMKELNMTEYYFKKLKNAIESAPDMAHVEWPDTSREKNT